MTNAQSTLTCSACGSSTVIQIDLTLPDGTAVEFYSCHDCENRWWDREGEPLPLTDVLELARKARS